MIGQLPDTLEVDNREYAIHPDFRNALLIFHAYNNTELSSFEKARICLECLYETVPENEQKAYEKAIWFLDGGDTPKPKKAPKKLMDWEQDESIIFPAVNKAAGYETRSTEFLHWWSFLGLFNEIGEGLYSQVMNIRAKKAKNKKLEKWEREFYNDHKELIDLKKKYTVEEQEEMERIKQLLD